MADVRRLMFLPTSEIGKETFEFEDRPLLCDALRVRLAESGALEVTVRAHGVTAAYEPGPEDARLLLEFLK